jgi:hypothetical protein
VEDLLVADLVRTRQRRRGGRRMRSRREVDLDVVEGRSERTPYLYDDHQKSAKSRVAGLALDHVSHTLLGFVIRLPQPVSHV